MLRRNSRHFYTPRPTRRIGGFLFLSGSLSANPGFLRFGAFVLKFIRPARNCSATNVVGNVGCAHAVVVASLILSLFGCEGRSIKEDNPVVGPPPPRRTMDVDQNYYAQAEAPAMRDDQQEPGHSFRRIQAQPASYTNAVLDADLTGNQIVATIDGEPVFAEDVLEGFGKQLAKAEKQLPPEQFRKAKLQLVQRELPSIH